MTTSLMKEDVLTLKDGVTFPENQIEGVDEGIIFVGQLFSVN